ncbi:MAG: M23 family metallopeptidase, partial [Alistipes sp.]|nr:M23 family metallopeptidase [Alistipes sp.]
IYTPYARSKYAELTGDDYTPLMIDTWKRLDAFGRQLYRTSVSFDELQILAKNKENMSTAIPAIWPIDRQALRGGIEPFGYRNHPIYHRWIFHKGIDLAADIGNNVYATGDATVQFTDQGQPRRGYGKQILLDHEFGYQTRYAHLDQIFVKAGERVVRGQLIGKVGRTGGVTGPHLHYEVIHAGNVVNPINYFNRNMTNEEYERLMEQMHELNLDKFEE